MKKQEPRWYLLWFITAGMWLLTFCGHFFYHKTLDWIAVMQFFNIFLSLAAGFVNKKRYRNRRNMED